MTFGARDRAAFRASITTRRPLNWTRRIPARCVTPTAGGAESDGRHVRRTPRVTGDGAERVRWATPHVRRTPRREPRATEAHRGKAGHHERARDQTRIASGDGP